MPPEAEAVQAMLVAVGAPEQEADNAVCAFATPKLSAKERASAEAPKVRRFMDRTISR